MGGNRGILDGLAAALMKMFRDDEPTKEWEQRQ
jgi:hypothetical protein